ncbi:hypothetical protein NADE_002534 [Nannochloris sp. 'desiccata']|nr:hypothetical protein KSW81_005747 [Chlorella desiccata (nom. nud.)]KAH7623344.1 hypothetical protein NADE_002534 [Chlorella desiccata (nom. nud.)]
MVSSTATSARCACGPSKASQHSISQVRKIGSHPPTGTPLRIRHTLRSTNPKDDDKPTEDLGLGLKSVWVGAEILGNVVGAAKGNQPSTSTSVRQQGLSREQAIESIRKDYDVSYFVSGQGDLSAYDPDCRFADPFASFRGTERFQRNVGNLGGMLQDVQLDISEFSETADGNLKTKWRFSAILDLPWKPRLAAAGGTMHILDPNTNLVVEHIESWDVKPGAVVKTLLKPSAKIPTSNWDVLFNSIHDGDLSGIWLASSSNVIKLTGAVVVLSFVLKLVTGNGLDAWPVAAAGFVAGLITEVLKISGVAQGGESN